MRHIVDAAMLRTIVLSLRYFEDVTLEAGVDMDNSYRRSLLNRGTYTFGSSFTVSRMRDMGY